MLRIGMSWVMMVVLLTSCGPDYLIHEQRVVDPAGWRYADSLTYSFAITDTLVIYDLHLTLEHTEAFPYENLYVRLKTHFPAGERTDEQVSLQLAGRGGAWLGDCGAQTCTLHIPLQQGAYFSQVGNYEFTVVQHSRRDTLPGITAIAFALEDTGQRRD